jgi:hypothetical protein
MCTCHCRCFRKKNCFHLLGCAIDVRENVVASTSVLQRAYQVNVEMSRLGMGMGCGNMRVWRRWILLRWQCRQDFAQLVTFLARPCQTNLEDTRHREASFPGWEMLCKCKKMSFGNFAGTMRKVEAAYAPGSWPGQHSTNLVLEH